MLERKHIEAIREHAPDNWFMLNKAIGEALAAADERDAAFERAMEAWEYYRLAAPGALAEQSCNILDAYFNPAKEG